MGAFAIILAGGRSERFGADKVMEDLGGRPVWKCSFDTFRSHPLIEGVGVVASSTNIESIRGLGAGSAFVVLGGDDRAGSARNGLACVPEGPGAILVHDGARPFVSSSLITRMVEAIEVHGAAAAAIPAVDTLREVSGEGEKLLDRSRIVCMQSPQGASREKLIDAYGRSGPGFTDDMGFLSEAGYAVTIVPGDVANFKITTAEDLARARATLGGMEMRTGLGYDVHRFSQDPGRPLWLGGILFTEGPGLEGHSDADVIIHAAVDALLGAAALGDIGQHFPPSEARWKDEPSSTFLRHAGCLLGNLGWDVVNLDIAVIAEKPRIMGHAAEMRTAMAACLGVGAERVSVKATTNEGLGSIGRGEGVAAFATATIRHRSI